MKNNGKYYYSQEGVFPEVYLKKLQKSILQCEYMAINNLNRDFIGTRGFSIVFQRTAQEKVVKNFPFFEKYLAKALDPLCNAFYLNPLLLNYQSRVDPHIDRSLRSYLKTIDPPNLVSVLYVQVPENVRGGELVLSHNRKKVGEIKPRENTLLFFQGNLTHSVNRMNSEGNRLSLVCEQYFLDEGQLAQVPEYVIESRKLRY
jgi:hypothetical protein